MRLRCAFGKRDAMKKFGECTYQAELDVETLVCTGVRRCR
jgi:hypothetical protein